MLRSIYGYLLFFSITIASLLGFTAVLNGSHAVSTNPFIYGLSFYTAYCAYYVFTNKIKSSSVFVASNPMLLFTGPIAVSFLSLGHKSLSSRVNYFGPFFIIGLFFYKIIAVPLTQFFWLLDLTNISEVILFGVIFELFIYFNFCGLSLVIYSLFGIIGAKIPLNFMQPFSSKNIIEFWRGWHRSLSTVLRVLFYLPAKNYFSTPIALFAVYIGSALWHGVTLNFFIWGSFHALCFIITIKLLKRNFTKTSTALMFFTVIYGRVIFADSNSSRLIEKLTPTIGTPLETLETLLATTPLSSFIALGFAFLLVFIEFFYQNYKHIKKRNYKFLRLRYSQLILVLIFILLIGSSTGIDYAAYGQR
ncbi:hypothetical protein N9Y96_01165 [Gammaproteobacteria bacterium]|nr:hypothetical protein [Gammaproteobacteria bacterium]MDB9842364.1 hypothetical protein [Gammaproteobacteria bacterium]